MPMTKSGQKQVLVVKDEKDDMSGFVQLFAAGSDDATIHQDSAGFVHPTSKEVYVADRLDDTRQKHVTDLQVALEEMHREVAVQSDKLRRQAHGRHERKSQVKFAGFVYRISCQPSDNIGPALMRTLPSDQSHHTTTPDMSNGNHRHTYPISLKLQAPVLLQRMSYHQVAIQLSVPYTTVRNSSQQSE
ncbi:hypothetical protein H257_13316 [Aphanomyces astaci]|uniref:Uncharacterized protein n=1 Tax=Aphanomyces astaci TaxID=112090 RepID=W4FXN5_APHAT|nr:hypothetical protein H257_13316 [Aphanomyces astaci]ETV71433.1 hypothetical protein H257_13316 [Aphanomyces astaci]|eukprot:XP_009839098.1 hypothetical protein H257_13316 [Aphanomyces astaci]